MKATKIIGIAASSVLALSLFFGCAKKSDKAVLGRLALSNVSEEEFNDGIKQAQKALNSKNADRNGGIKYFDTLNSMLMSLDSGEISIASIYETISNYIVARNGRYDSVAVDGEVDFSFALREDSADLLAQFNMAITEMKADGTLAALTDKYINNLPADVIPAPVALPVKAGAPTIKVAVTGDLPPLDLILADGTPAGFNTAVLAEISKKIGKNIELVSVDTGARAAALASKRVDVVFWVVTLKDVPGFNATLREYLKGRQIDMPEGIVATESYFTDKPGFLSVKK